MKALMINYPDQFYGLTEHPRPTLKADEILVRVDSAAICHTDINMRAGLAKRKTGVFIPGHEFSGIVEACGSEVDYLSVGDRGAVQQHIGCNHCPSCRMGFTSRCQNFSELGMTRNGGFAEFCVMPARNFHKLPEGISLEEASLCEPLANAVSAVSRVAIKPTERVVIIGPGAIGLMCVRVAQLFGPSMVILVGTRDSRLAIGKDAYGATATVNIRKDGAEQYLKEEILEGQGADAIIECSGSRSGLELALGLLAPGGRIACEGNIPREDTILFTPSLIQLNCSIHGMCGWEPAHFQTAFNLVAKKMIDLSPLITHRFPLKEWERGFQVASEGKDEAIRVLLKPQQGW